MAGDIKSGVGLEGASEDLGAPKLHYAVQIALYTDILERRGWAAGRTPFILDVRGQEVPHDLDELRGRRNPSSRRSSAVDPKLGLPDGRPGTSFPSSGNDAEDTDSALSSRSIHRALTRDGVWGEAGTKVIEIDGRGDPAAVFGLVERPHRIGDAVRAVIEAS